MKTSALLSFCVLASAATAFPSFFSEYEHDGAKALKNNRGGNSIMDRLRERKEFSRMVEVIESEKGLRDELESGKRTTFFCPDNKAIEKWESEQGKKSSKSQMRDILRFHISPESDISGDCLHAGALIPTDLRPKSLEGRHQRIRVFKFADDIWLNMGARVVEKDIEADNGRIHAIDRVMVPPEQWTEMVSSLPTRFSTFLAGVERTGLGQELCREKSVTAFIPGNHAWTQLGHLNLKYLFSCVGQRTESRSGKGGQDRLMCQGIRDLEKILRSHVGLEIAFSTDMMEKNEMTIKSMGDEKIRVCAKRREGSQRRGGEGHQDVRDYMFVVNDGQARIQFTDGLGSDGVVQIIDSVMIPKDVKLPYERIL